MYGKLDARVSIESIVCRFEAELKLRAHNQLVGRLIGKGGQTIRKLMDETDCTVFVSKFVSCSVSLAIRILLLSTASAR